MLRLATILRTTALAGASLAQVAVAQTTPFATAAVSDDSLGRIAGREDTNQTAIADQQATVTRNSVGNNVQTGDAKIADNAFQNLSGLSVVNVNTGNNVAINAAMNVTISIQPSR